MADPGRLSVLGQLSKRHDDIKNAQQLTMAIPRWSDPEIWVRLKPIAHEDIRRAMERIDKAQKAMRGQVELEQNIDLLIKACIGVFATLGDDPTEYSLRPDDPEGDHTRFDHDLAANLGLSEGVSARHVVKALYITEGDILSHAKALIEWSGYRDTEAEETIAGES